MAVGQDGPLEGWLAHGRRLMQGARAGASGRQCATAQMLRALRETEWGNIWAPARAKGCSWLHTCMGCMVEAGEKRDWLCRAWVLRLAMLWASAPAAALSSTA
jgi:hypothetical protein